MMEVKLSFPGDNPPLSVIATAKLAGIPISVDSSLASGSLPSFLISSSDNEYVPLFYLNFGLNLVNLIINFSSIHHPQNP